MPNSLPNANPLSYLGVRAETPPQEIVAQTNPSVADRLPVGTLWTNEVTGVVWSLVQYIAGVPSWVILAGTAGYPETPYVVGAVGQAGYQTIQSAINAANAAGGGLVYIQPGTYTENLTLRSNVFLKGASAQDTTIIGLHTPPAAGTLNFEDLTFSSATHVLSSAAAGTTTIAFIKCNFIVTNGYICNLANWTGSMALSLCGDSGSTNNGVINNSTTAPVSLYNSNVGAGVGHSLTSSASLFICDDTQISCPIALSGACLFAFNAGSIIQGTLTTAGTANGFIEHAVINSGAAAALTHGSAGIVKFDFVVIDSSANPAFAGAGAGALTIGSVVWLNGNNIAGTLTIDDSLSLLTASQISPSNATSWNTLIANRIVADGVGAAVDTQVEPKGTGAFKVLTGNIQATNGNLVLNTAGNKIVSTSVATTTAAGANSFGSVTLVGGTATVNTTAVTANSLIKHWRQSVGATGAAATGNLSIGTITAGTSFVINAVQAADATALQASDVSVVGWEIVN